MKRYFSILYAVIKYIFLWDDIASEYVTNPKKNHLVTRGRFAFIVSVTIASLVFTFILCGSVALTRAWLFSAEHTWLAKLKDIGHTMVTVFIISWILTFLSAIIPYILGFSLAIWKKQQASGWFFVIGAVLTALLQSLTLGRIPGFGFNAHEGDAQFLLGPTQYVAIVFGFCGLLAGFACWCVVRLPQKVKPTPSSAFPVDVHR